MRRWLFPILIFAFSFLGLAALTTAYYMPEIREALIFQPARRSAEEAVRSIAEGEKAVYRKTGKLLSLSLAATAPGSSALAFDWVALNQNGFQYDAMLQPNRQMRVRALPTPEAAADLRVPPQIYVADLSPQGDFLKGGWVP